MMTRTNMMALGLLLPVLGFGEWTKIDDFQSYPQAKLTKGENGWRCYNDKITTVTVSSDELAPGNLAAKIHHGDDTIEKNHNYKHDVFSHNGAVNIPPGGTATLYLRFLIESGLDKTLGHVRGVEPVEAVNLSFSFNERDALVSFYQRGGVFLEGKNARIMGLGRTRRSDQKDPAPQIKRNRWYRLWMVVHNAPGGEENKSRAYIEEEGGDGTKMPIPGYLIGEKGYNPVIWKTVGLVKSPNCALTDVFLDDIYVDNSGENLTQPVSGKEVKLWRQKLEEEAKQYAHLLKKADTRDQAEKQARELLAAMTLDERFELVTGFHGGVLRLGIPPVLHNDAGSGINNGNAANRSRLERTVAYPCTLALAATWNPEMAEAYGRSLGEECRRGGTAILLGPGMNLYRSAIGGRNFEYFGEDPLLTGRQVAAYVCGMQGAGTAATLKHFIGNEYEFHRRGSNSQIDERTLHEVYMEPFRMGIEAGALCVMSSYNQLNGEWAGQSKYVNTDLLRGSLGFKGIIMTDWIATYDAAKFAASGADLEMPGGTSMVREREKVFGTPAIDRMALSFLTVCIQAGFFDRPATMPKLEKHRPRWEQVARDTNLEGITLLKNSGMLPLNEKYRGKKIVVAGNRATTEELAGGGSGHVPGYDNKTYLQAVTETFVGAEVLNPLRPDKLTDEQIRAADLVLLFPGMAEGEGRDRIFALPDDDLITRCVTNNPKTVVCLVTGGGVQMEWADKAAAIVHAYYGGQTGASALMDILTGRAEPSGRLPFTIERRVEDAPGGDLKALQKPNLAVPYEVAKVSVPGDLFLNNDKTLGYVWDNPYTEGVFTGHRWYESKNIPVRFPFGFGLGYTTFAYENLKVDVKGQTVKVSFTLKNVGKRPGAEVAQVYVSDKVCSVPRPPQELKAFQKVRLDAGKSKRVEIELSSEAFRFWNPATKQWTVEPGEFEIRVGASSADIRLKEMVVVPDNSQTGLNDRQTRPCGVTLSLVSEQPEAVIGKKHPGSEGNKYGYEGGSVLKLEGTYHLFTAEMVGDPLWVKMRLGHWTSPDRLTWTRRGTMYESSGDPTGKDPRASFWSPMPIYNEKEGRWNFFYVAYRAQVGPLGWNGRIWRAVSKVKGPAGIDGPWEDVGVILQPGPAGGAWEADVMKGGVPSDKILKPGPESGEWEGSQGVDSFYPYQVGDTWLGFYGSCNGKNWFKVGLAEAPGLAGPWKRLAALNPVGIASTRGPENPVVLRLKSGRYIAVYEVVAREDGFGYADSPDGIHWSKGSELTLTEAPKRLRKVRTPLGLVPEPDGSFTILFTGYTRAENWGEVWMARVRVEE